MMKYLLLICGEQGEAEPGEETIPVGYRAARRSM